jgi:hypothetical protein
MKKIPLFLLSLFAFSASPAQAVTPRVSDWNSLTSTSLAGSSDYQIGSEWGKKAVTAAMLASETPEFVRAAKVTASYGGGTAFYLGKINGRHLMGTNHHVQPSLNCQGSVRFQVLGKSFPCKQIFGHWTAVDFALFEISVPAIEESTLLNLGRNFAFDRPLQNGQLLMTIGHGVAANSGRKLVANQDSDCKVFSETNEFRFMGDPDEYNPGEYQAWSFANGCDVSHGDSGSAMVDRLTGEPVGIIWTGRIPKSAETQNSKNLDDWLRTKNEKIWKELSYAVPAAKIREVLQKYLTDSPQLPRDTAETISAMIH